MFLFYCVYVIKLKFEKSFNIYYNLRKVYFCIVDSKIGTKLFLFIKLLLYILKFHSYFCLFTFYVIVYMYLRLYLFLGNLSKKKKTNLKKDQFIIYYIRMYTYLLVIIPQ